LFRIPGSDREWRVDRIRSWYTFLIDAIATVAIWQTEKVTME
jgi:hypothetical protein